MATIDNGKPHVVPLWYYYFDWTNIVLTVTKDMKKAKSLKKNPNLSIAIDVIEGEPGNISFLKGKAMKIEGEAAWKMISMTLLKQRCSKDMQAKRASTVQWLV